MNKLVRMEYEAPVVETWELRIEGIVCVSAKNDSTYHGFNQKSDGSYENEEQW